jgi:uncharacterized membrane protein
MNNFVEFLIGPNLMQLTQGTFTFGTSISPWLISGAVALILAVVWIFYRTTTVPVRGPVKLLLISLKSAALMLLFFCLLRPLLTHSIDVPQKNYLAIAVDNSQSMTIQDITEDRSRRDAVAEMLYGKNGLVDRLQKDFQLQIFRFDKEITPLSGMEHLNAAGLKTDLSRSLEQVAAELSGMSPVGLILITDGADKGNGDPVRTASLVRFPVFTVGIGQENAAKDLEIVQVDTVKTITEEAIVEAHVTVRSRGYNGREIDLQIEEGDNIVASKRIRLDKSGHTRRYTMELIPEKDGPIVYSIRIPEQNDEIVKENNRWPLLVDNTRKRSSILYIEGHPRNEYKFIRRAVEADKTLRLVSYLQTGPNKFLRQGIESPKELATGYPAHEADLFKYHAIVFGDIPKRFFTGHQLTLTREFVSKRGGGFLMIGGSTAFDEAFINTPIADLLPVTLMSERKLPAPLLGGSGKGEHPTGAKFNLRPTDEGEQEPLLRMGPMGEINRQWWEKMPTLQGIHVTGRTKPGATVLAVHPTLRFHNAPLPVIAYQRYGRGRTMAITTASTWRWQMLMPHKDTSHERFWRQILRWLASESPARLDLTLDRNAYNSGDEVQVRVRVSDDAYVPVNNATVWMKIKDSGDINRDVRLVESTEEDGIYTGTFTATKEGVYHLEVSSTTPTGDSTETSARFLVAKPNAEYIDTAMDADLLRTIATTSGGKFYTPENVRRLADDVQMLQKKISTTIEQDVWNIPLVLILLVTFLGTEWFIRRQKGMS